ncbi:hypothetical protein DEVEQU_00154 [Devosia equisanguinis]|uniref:Uncharacterized protein n=1 Tax=Devosia equisanguinis TaxID=2490941 RepID=A0A3S4GF12_9HYPH|nr:hypothetical protein [Devosia equisanguinis]VDS03034.1 hypothetical protein DEVEQU_00154 [Devosia equisanguinis]
MTKHADDSTDIAFTTPIISAFVPLAICFMGYLFRGRMGLAIGIAVSLSLVIIGFWLDARRRPGFAIPGVNVLVQTVAFFLRAIVIAAAAAVTLLVASLWIIGGWVGVLFANLTGPIRRLLPKLLPTFRIERPRLNWERVWADVVKADNLALFILNMLLLLAIACIFIGMEVALYVAIVLTPIWLLGLVLLAIQGNDPQFVFVDEHGLDVEE